MAYDMMGNGVFGGSNNFFNSLGNIGINAMQGANSAMAFHNNYMDYLTNLNTHQNVINAKNANLTANETKNLINQQLNEEVLEQIARLRQQRDPRLAGMIDGMIGNYGQQGFVNNQQSVYNTHGTSQYPQVTPAHTPATQLSAPAQTPTYRASSFMQPNSNATGTWADKYSQSTPAYSYLQKFGGY